MRTRALVLTCALLLAVTVLVGPVAAQKFEMEPSVPKDYDEENQPPVVYEDRRFDFEVSSMKYDVDLFETEVWYPHEYLNLTVVPASTAWNLEISRANRDSQTSLKVRGELKDDYQGQGYSGSTLFKLHVTAKQELKYATLRIEPLRLRDVDGVPYDSTQIRSEDQKIEMYPYPKPESDIQITDVEVSPEEVALGDRITVVFEAENKGEAQGTHTAEMRVDGEPVGESKEFPLGGGETYSWDFWYTFEPGEYEPGEYEVSVNGDSETVEVLSSGLVGIEVVGVEYGTLSAAESGVASAGSQTAGVEANSTDNSSGGSDVQAAGGGEGQQMPGFTAVVAMIALLFAAALRLR